MKNIFFLLIFSLMLLSCGASKTGITQSKRKSILSNKSITKADKIVHYAQQYKGVKYKFGGITSKGMDCSGLVYVAFGKEKLKLPRVSRDMAKIGSKIPLEKVKKGDLLFFKTNKSSRQINHVGLVTAIKNRQIWFIHSTTSEGVIISSLTQKYWKNAFVKATKIL